MILELDAGNTRIKWRLIRSGQEGRAEKLAQGSVLALRKVPSVFIELGQQLDRLPLDQVSRMKVANVRGPSFQDAISALMTEKWHLQPEFAVVRKHCAGVTNSYAEAQRMGADRWLAMLAAWREAGGACCVVDCGSALTVDLVDAAGTHLGGYIVPGLGLMRSTLADCSPALRLEGEPDWRDTAPGTCTRAALENGMLCMLLGLLERVRRAQDARGEVRWFLTGGDARAVSAWLDWEHQVLPDLVLDGLALAMR